MNLLCCWQVGNVSNSTQGGHSLEHLLCYSLEITLGKGVHSCKVIIRGVHIILCKCVKANKFEELVFGLQVAEHVSLKLGFGSQNIVGVNRCLVERRNFVGYFLQKMGCFLEGSNSIYSKQAGITVVHVEGNQLVGVGGLLDNISMETRGNSFSWSFS